MVFGSAPGGGLPGDGRLTVRPQRVTLTLPSLPPSLTLTLTPRQVIILEEDLEVAPDSFDYFAAAAPLLDDPAERLLAVSAWNDNGQEAHVKDATAVYRSR